MTGNEITIYETEHYIEIKNNFSINLIISVKPKKPKIKYRDILLVRPGCFLIIEKNIHFQFSITDLSFSFEGS